MNEQLKKAGRPPKDNLNDAGYMPERNEDMNHYHVRIDQVFFNSKTGEKVSKPMIQQYAIEEWEKPLITKSINGKSVEVYMSDMLKNEGYTIEILWTPKKKEVVIEKKGAADANA
jgi:hypothetical protein